MSGDNQTGARFGLDMRSDGAGPLLFAGLPCSSGMDFDPAFFVKISFHLLRPLTSREVAARRASWELAGPEATLAPILAHVTDPAVQQQSRLPPVTILTFALPGFRRTNTTWQPRPRRLGTCCDYPSTRSPSHVATIETLFHAGRGPAHPEASPPAASASLHATGGTQPPVRLPHRHHPDWSVRRIAGHLGGELPRPRVQGCLPVQRCAAGRRLPGRARLQPHRQIHLEPHAGGDLLRSGWMSRTECRRKSEFTTVTYTAQTRVVGDTAVVNPMANPLVALYSASLARPSMYVQFAKQGPTLSWQNTSPLPIVPGESTNFIVAGMLPNTTYLMRHVLDDGTVSAPLTFTTGSLPANLQFPAFSVLQPPAAGTDLTQSMIFHAGINKNTSINAVNTLATDLNGNVIWYYDPEANRFASYAQNLEPDGTVMLLGGNAIGVAAGYNTLRQVDLAGDTLRETNIHAVNAKLAAMHQPQILEFDHEAKLLPNGDTVVIATTPKTVNYKGKPTRFIGDMVIVLDQNFQPSVGLELVPLAQHQPPRHRSPGPD